MNLKTKNRLTLESPATPNRVRNPQRDIELSCGAVRVAVFGTLTRLIRRMTSGGTVSHAGRSS
jgi:hypothetical protein